MILDPIYFLFIAPGFILSLWASWKVRSTFNKLSHTPNLRGLTGKEAAEAMLRAAGIYDVKVVPTYGHLTDYYHPLQKVLALSESVYGSRSIAAIGVACHEAGHAIQHAKGYVPLYLRSMLVPATTFATNAGYFVMLGGLLMNAMGLVALGGILAFGVTLLFQIVTLPVEFDASKRAKEVAFEIGLVTEEEKRGMAKVLNAAALTYVAAAITTLLTLLYYLWRAGLLAGSNED